MLLRPVDKLSGVMDDVVESTSSVTDISNEIMIHDIIDLTNTFSHNSLYDIMANATQIIETKVKGFPRDTNVEAYMNGTDKRTSFVRYVYNYEVMMSSGYKTQEDRIKHAVFLLKSATAVGFSDAKPIPDYYHTDESCSFISNDYTNSFSASVYMADNNLFTTVGKPSSSLSHIRLNICSPIDFKVREMCESTCLDLLLSSDAGLSSKVKYTGEQLVNNGPAKASVVVVESRLSDKENDERYASDIRASLPMFGNDDSGSHKLALVTTLPLGTPMNLGLAVLDVSFKSSNGILCI